MQLLRRKDFPVLTRENKRKIEIFQGKLEYIENKASKSIHLLIKFIREVEEKAWKEPSDL